MSSYYRYRLFPTKAQTTRFKGTLDLCCELYNAALQERRDAWRINRESINNSAQSAQLPDIKEVRPELNGVYAQVLQDVLRRLDKAFQGFFRRAKAGGKPGFPRFRSSTRYNSFTYPQFGFSVKGNGLTLSKIGKVRIKLHRPLEGQVKALTITRTTTGKWFACFCVEAQAQLMAANNRAVGIDVGLSHFATLSTGEQIGNPRFFRTDERALVKAQRREKRKVARRIHERIVNRRRNFAHQLSYALVSTFGIIALERLNIRGMVRNHSLAKSIHDAAWSQLVQFTTYKAENAGRTVRLVDPRNTSKRCSACGTLVEKSLAERVHHCLCGLVLDRDHNAAINILALGLQSLESQHSKKPRTFRARSSHPSVLATQE